MKSLKSLLILFYRCINSANNVTYNLINNQPQSIYANGQELNSFGYK